MNDDFDCIILLIYIEDPTEWSAVELQQTVVTVIETVNYAADLTGIVTSGLFIDKWGQDPVLSLLVEHDDRYASPEDADTMITQLFTKTLDICGLSEKMYVMDYDERSFLDAES